MKSRIVFGLAVVIAVLFAWLHVQSPLQGQNPLDPPTQPPARVPSAFPAAPSAVPPSAAPPSTFQAVPRPVAPAVPPTGQMALAVGGFSLEQFTLANKTVVYMRINRTTGNAVVSFDGNDWGKLAEKAAVPPGDYQVLLAQGDTAGAFDAVRFDRLTGRMWVLDTLAWLETKEPQ